MANARVLAAVVALVVGLPTAAAAQEDPLVPPLAPPGADEAGRVQAEGELRVAEGQLKVAKAVATRATRLVRPAEERVAVTLARVHELDAIHKQAASHLADARERLRKLAVASYVTGGQVQSVDFLLRSVEPADLHRRKMLVDEANDVRLGAFMAAKQAEAAANAEVKAAVVANEQAAIEHRKLLTAARVAERSANDLVLEVDHRRQLLDLVTAAAEVPPSDIPRLFLDAYRSAAARQALRTPGCRVQWTALAGIGKIETNHGRYRGARLALNGDVYPRIIGIPLDGTRSRLVRDTDTGELDGDAQFDRAVGPMQFIPGTWRRLGVDGNGDGRINPHNAYDAAQSAAAYLCRAQPGGGLDRVEQLRPALFSYNRSTSYGDSVLSWMQTYEGLAGALPPPAPISGVTRKPR